MQTKKKTCNAMIAVLLATAISTGAYSATITVEAGGDIAAANATAVAGDVIQIAAGTFVLTEQIELKDGVAYQGAGAGLTIIDGGGTTRAFTAWGDLGATNGQVDAEGNSVPNLTGPTGWVLEGLTIQSCVADAASRQDILSAARDLLNNYVAGTPYTLAAAQAENGGITDNPGWFDILSGGADDNLTDAELQAYLDANPVGSAGHLVANEGMNTGGGALILRNGAAGTVQNCSFLNNQAPLNSGDGGAVNTSGSGVALTIDNCEFIGNSCDDGGGALRMSSASACTITGTIFTGNQAVVGSGDGGAIMTANPGTTLTIDNCEFNGNSCIDAGGALRLGATESTCTITGSTFTGNYIVEASGDGGAIRVTGDDSTYVLTDCSFIGNTAADDGGAVRYGPDRAELTVTNCAFISNGKDADGNTVGDDGGAWSTNDDDCGPMTFENCLFADNASTDDRIIEVKAAFAFLNCTFIGNVAGDEAILAIRGQDWDSTGDGVDDITTDDSIIANCLFINNTMLSNKQIIGDTRNDIFAPTVINCLFFGNLDENNQPAANTDDNSTEVGTIDVSAVTDATQIVVDPAGDYHLVAGSPAIDASDPATATATDIEGTAAVGVRDVGAYEYSVPPVEPPAPEPPAPEPPAATGGNILYVASMTVAEDDIVKAYLEGLGHTVTYIDDDEDEATTEAAALAADVVFISESVSSGKIKNEITELEVPMVVGEPYAWDEMGLTEGGGGDDPAVTTDIEIVNPEHYLAAGLSGTVTVLTEVLAGCNLGKGITGPEATVIATATLSDGVTYDVIFVYEKGAALPVAPADGSPQVAADIRIGIGFHANCYPALSDNYYALLGAAVDYALGLAAPPEPEPAPPEPEPAPPTPGVVERRIAAGSDDAEERLDRDHEVELDSSDLELAWEDWFQGDMQIIGLRFTDITIAKGAKIKEAWVQFEVDETKGGTYPVFLAIEGELSADAATFTTAARDITGRPRTRAGVRWHVPNWTVKQEQGPAQKTPDISAIIQEIVNQDDWVSGNSLALIFGHSYIISTGIRCAESFEGTADAAPLLHIKLATP